MVPMCTGCRDRIGISKCSSIQADFPNNGCRGYCTHIHMYVHLYLLQGNTKGSYHFPTVRLTKYIKRAFLWEGKQTAQNYDT